MSKWLFHAQRLLSQIWVRATAFCLFAVLGALAGVVLAPFVPASLQGVAGGDAVDRLLSILAAGMLPVATFSLATMVAGYQAATSNVTPRATALLIEDAQAQRALATFIGAFLYAVVGLTVLSAELYGPAGRVILLGFTIAVILAVVATLVCWVDGLARLGSVGETIDRIETATRQAITMRTDPVDYGGRPLLTAPPGAAPVRAASVGHAQNVDSKALRKLAEEADCRLFLAATPGLSVHVGDVLCHVDGGAQGDEAFLNRVAGSFVIGDARTFKQDPRFGFVVLAEVASRALSPAINDPGAAVDVIGTGARLLSFWAERMATRDDAAAPASGRLFVGPLTAAAFFDDFFRPIARDGAALVEVGTALQRTFTALARFDGAIGVAARALAREALDRAEKAVVSDVDLDLIRRAGDRA